MASTGRPICLNRYIYKVLKEFFYSTINNLYILAVSAVWHKMESEILLEIKETEKKADETIERAKMEGEMMVQEAIKNSSKLLAAAEDELRKAREKKIADFREKAKLIKEEKLAEGKIQVKQLKAKSEKNIAKAADIVLKKFEEMV